MSRQRERTLPLTTDDTRKTMADLVDQLRYSSDTDEGWRWDAPIRCEAANEIERLRAENERHLKSVKRLADREIDLCDRLDSALAEVRDYKQAAIDAESRLIDLTEKLLWYADEKGVIHADQIRAFVKRASASHG